MLNKTFEKVISYIKEISIILFCPEKEKDINSIQITSDY